MQSGINPKLLDEQDLEQFYKFVNKAQKKYTQSIENSEKIDLFIVLDISGSMNMSCNKFVNTGAGYALTTTLAGASLGLAAMIATGGITALPLLGSLPLSGLGLSYSLKKQIDSAKSRLEEAKTHLIIQIKQLIKQNRINKIGLIIFNHQAKISCHLTNDFDRILSQIQTQEAYGNTALYDSLKFVVSQMKVSKNPRVLVMTDGQDNCSKSKDMEWTKEWFSKDGLKSTFFTICEGNNPSNVQLAKVLQSKYIKLGEQCWFSNRFNDESMVRGLRHLE